MGVVRGLWCVILCFSYNACLWVPVLLHSQASTLPSSFLEDLPLRSCEISDLVLSIPHQPEPQSQGLRLFPVLPTWQRPLFSWGDISFYHCDGVQDTLPWNMASWHLEYFKLRKLEKMTKTGRSLWPPPHTLLPWNWSQNPPVRGVLPLYTWKIPRQIEHLYLQRQRDAKKNLHK